MPKVTIHTLREKRAKKEPMTYLTAYDYPTAILEQKAGIDVILVGDSIGMVIYGYDSTLPVTIDLMMPHVKAVRLGAPDVYLVGDMPYMSYQVSKSEAIRNGGRFMAEGACDAVKLEGGREMAETIRAMVDASIPVMGHMGLTPQSAAQLGGYRVQGKDVATAKKLIEDADILQEAGVSTLLLEAVPAEVARIITKRASVPIFGIGAGPHCDGQVLVIHDMIGMFDRRPAKFVKKYAEVGAQIVEALGEFKKEVTEGAFPATEHCYPMPEDVAAELAKLLPGTGLKASEGTQMRVGIVGAGALGSVLGGLLSEGGVDAVLVERDSEQVRVVREDGLWLEGVSGDRLIRPQIVWDPAEAGKVDLALVLVKAYDTRGAICHSKTNPFGRRGRSHAPKRHREL